MSDVTRHYDELLAGCYAWMFGDPERKLDAEASILREMGAGRLAKPGALALDLGAGCGFQSLPLAKMGFRVRAIDASEALVRELRARAGGLPVEARVGDICDPSAFDGAPYDLVACMGDTLTHLESKAHVATLVARAHAALRDGGSLLLTYRDLSQPRQGDARFLLVRADDRRSLTCFLEDAGDVVRVHDIVHERDGAETTMRVSSYPKLKLPLAWVGEQLAAAGLRVTHVEVDARGLCRVAAEKA